MLEKKTFNNLSSVVNTFDPEHTWLVYGFNSTGNRFTHREWDMEVIFTRRPPEFKPGQHVRNKYATAYLYTVLAQYKDQVICVDENDDEIEIFETDDIALQ